MSEAAESLEISAFGQIPPGWRETTLGDVGEYINGRGFKKSEWRKEGLPIIRIQDLTGTGKEQNYFDGEIEDRHVVEPGDLLISWSATLGAFIWDGPKAALNQHIFKVESQLKKKFHYYLIQFILDDLYRHTHGSGIVHITKGKFEAIRIGVPETEEEQLRIVAEIEKQFSRLDEAFAGLKRVKANLKRYKAAVLKAAVEGKLTEEWRKQNPDVEPASKLLERILNERRATWEEAKLAKMKAKGKEPKSDKWKKQYILTSELPGAKKSRLPNSWLEASIGQLFEVRIGATPSRKNPQYWNGQVPWVSSGEVNTCRIRKTKESITDEGLANSSTQLNPKGTVLLAMIGEGRTRGQAAILDIEAANNQNAAAIRVSETEVLPEYIFYMLVSKYEETRRAGSGGNQPALNKSRVQQIVFPLPPVSEQIQIVCLVEQLLSTESAVDTALMQTERRLAGLQQSLLAQAFTGRLVNEKAVFHESESK